MSRRRPSPAGPARPVAPRLTATSRDRRIASLASGLLAQGVALDPSPGWERLAASWLAELAVWNARMDLTAARDDDELVDLMLADAWVLASRILPAARVVDVGTGAGAPGLALSILRADAPVTMVEPLQKRASFLRARVGMLVDRPLELLPVRGETLPDRGWDVAISRATLTPPAWLALGVRLAASTWVLLARDAPPEVRGATLVEDLPYTWPLTGSVRRACRYVTAAS